MLHVDLSEVAYIIEGKATETTPVTGSSKMRFLLDAAAQNHDSSARDIVATAGRLHSLLVKCCQWVIIQHYSISSVHQGNLTQKSCISCAGEFVGCIIVDQNDGPGCQNFSAGGVVGVPANTLHSAENPGCTPTRAMQALSGAVSISSGTEHLFRMCVHICATWQA